MSFSTNSASVEIPQTVSDLFDRPTSSDYHPWRFKPKTVKQKPRKGRNFQYNNLFLCLLKRGKVAIIHEYSNR